MFGQLKIENISIRKAINVEKKGWNFPTMALTPGGGKKQS